MSTIKNQFSTGVHQPRLMGVCLLLVASLITGCTAKLAYQNLDWIVLEFIEDYVTLDSEQEDLLEQHLEYLVEWHKYQEMPQYQKQLQSLYAKDLSSVDQDYIAQQQELFRSHIKRFSKQVTPDLYLLSRSLTMPQVNELLDNLHESHQEYTAKLDEMSDEELRENYRKQINKHLRKWLGDISVSQQAITKQWSEKIHITHHDWATYRMETRDRVRTLFVRRDDPFYFQNEFTSLINEPERNYSDDLSAKIAHNKVVMRECLVEILDLATETQKRHFRAEVKGLLDLVKDLQT